MNSNQTPAQPKNNLTFDPSKHTYTLTGRPVTSVTAILSGK